MSLRSRKAFVLVSLSALIGGLAVGCSEADPRDPSAAASGLAQGPAMNGMTAPRPGNAPVAERTGVLKPVKDGQRPAWEPGVVLVKWREDARVQVAQVAASLGLALQERNRIGVDRMRLLAAETVPEAVARLRKDPRVVYAEPNHRIALLNTPNDARYPECWGLNNTGQTGGTAGADIDAEQAWDISIGSWDVVVAVLDTGVDYNHEDLAPNMWTNPGEIPGNGVDDDNNGYVDDVRGWDFEHDINDPMDDYGHGTHCAGTIGAVGNNGVGVAGVNWRVSIMPLRIIGGQDLDTYCLDAAEAIHYAVDNGADIMSCSWWTVQHYNQTLEEAVEYAEQMDVALVAAAGNDSRDDDDPGYSHWPSEWPYANIVAVAATNHSDNIASFSNYGPTTVDVGAPGEDILSCSWGGGYETMSGTSMATPHVAGVLGLMLSIRPELTVAELKQYLFTTVDPIPDLQGITVTGGRVNAFRAMQAISGVPLAPVALAGGNQTVMTGSTVTLDGSASFDPNQDPIDYLWDFYPPGHSGASLDDPTSATPRFFGDVCGDYQAFLTVTDDGGLASEPDRARVFVRNWNPLAPVVESLHPYEDNTDQTWTITQPGAITLGLHFASFDTESGYDFVRILDGQDNEWALYDGALGEFNTIAVDGDTIRVHFTSDGSVTRDGFVIDGVWWCDAGNCPPGLGDCNDDPGDGCETDTTGDLSNCGWCGHACSFPNASAQCIAGVCQIDQCDAGWTDCDGDPANGCEADLLVDPDNCGQCGTTCGPYPNATAGCAGGQCAIGECDAGWGDCNGQLGDGCEHDVTGDVDNCGACDNVCDLDHAIDHECIDSVCQALGDCNEDAESVDSPHPYGDNYDNTWTITRPGAGQIAVHFSMFYTEGYYDFVYLYDGAGVEVAAYDGNLGPFWSVNVPGDTVQVRLVSDYIYNYDGFTIDMVRYCASGCEPGWGDCDGDPASGCEADLLSDLNNCGGCGQMCGAPNTDGECIDGVCFESADCQAGFADCDGDPGNGCETNIDDDLNNCGGCGTVCEYDNASGTCAGGTCAMAECDQGWADCNASDTDGCEVAIAFDADNCGACGNACDLPNVDGQHCMGGVCQIGGCQIFGENIQTEHPYLPDQDLEWTITHAGAPYLEVHFALLSTEAGYDYVELYDGSDNLIVHYEGDLGEVLSDPVPGDTVRVVFHSDYMIQYDGFILDYTRWCDGSGCAAGFSDCDGLPGNGCEADVQTDPANCGDCDTECTYDHADPICNAGACEMGACDSGFEDCNASDADGCEIDVWGDEANCGGCGTVCGPYDNGTPTCGQGTCRVACDPGFADCNLQVADGCEVDVQTDPANCGACAQVCDFDHAAGACVSGACEMGACDADWGDCNDHPVDGCESDLLNDAANCGACATACTYPNGTGACNAGTCELAACNAGFEDCDAEPATGCEVQPNIDPANCGACGQVCDLPGVDGHACVDGGCQVGTCDASLADCNAEPADGCEVDLTGDPANCGACGTACELPNATPACTAGACEIAACDAGFEDCDTDPATGCEIELGTDPLNCGACGTACGPYDNATPACLDGACALTCDDGYADCDADTATGCEVGLGTDTDCAACGDDCSAAFTNAGGSCTDGACQMGACADGFADCDADPATGCEVPLGTDTDCAACGDSCADAFPNAGGACAEGACQMGACAEGYGDCNADPADGCEVALDTNDNCGACGTACIDQENCVDNGAGYECIEGCVDVDGDGHEAAACGGEDCDDADADVHPGAEEICDDGVDQDCSGEDLPCDCLDADGDGHADATCGGDDCDDDDADVHPGAEEICDNDRDDDCDGYVDADDMACGDIGGGGGGGCGCASTGHPPLGAGLGVLALIGFALVRRRRTL